MEDVALQRLKVSLTEAIDKWANDIATEDDWAALDTHVSDFISELMADAAFAVLMAQSDLTTYYRREDLLKD